MPLKDFLTEIDQSVRAVLDSSFTVEIIDTKTVPSFSDSDLTFDNIDSKTKKCKRLESCVLYIDIRNSAAISTEKKPRTLSKLYSAFIRSMIKAAKYYGGHVRNVIGDRVMVVFDQDKCYTNAVNTAILMNTIAHHIIDKRYSDTFECGIGIDYGQMLVTKAGEIRRGDQAEFYRSLVWLGRPANIASRLTDLAKKTVSTTTHGARVGRYYPFSKEWLWFNESYAEFLDDFSPNYSGQLTHKDPHFCTFYRTSWSTKKEYPAILITEAVFAGYKAENPNDKSITEGWWKKQSVSIKEYSGTVYGGAAYFTAVDQI